MCIVVAPYLYYSLAPLQMLPARLIRHAVRFTTGRALPETVEGAQGMISGGRDVAVFVRFHTDKAGIQYMLRVFGGPGVRTETFNEEDLHSRHVFVMAEQWQERLNVRLYDRESIRSATVITPIVTSDGLDYILLIDLERDDIYLSGARM